MTAPAPTSTRRSTHRHGDGGYALLTVLVATMVFGLMVLSLLTLVGTDARVQPTYLMSDAHKRAVDGALTAALAKIKAVPAEELAAGSDGCAGMDEFDFEIEDRTVTVTCTEANDVEPPKVPVAIDDGRPVLTTLGSWPFRASLSDWLVTDLQWNPVFAAALMELLGVQDAENPALAYAGPHPLEIHGDVLNRTWSLFISPQADPHAIRVHGSYAQGWPGPYTCGEGTYYLPNTWIQLGYRGNLAADSGATCLNPASPDSVTTVEEYAVIGPIPAEAGALPTCVPGSVVTIPPGRYGASDIATLNSWFGPSECNDVTFWFPPGAYLFDAAALDLTGSLVFNDRTSDFVFGTPNGWDASARPADAKFPEACDPDDEGVTIVLGATTSLEVKAGRVVICGAPDVDDAAPVLSQLPPVMLPEVRFASEPDAAEAVDGTVTPTGLPDVTASVEALRPTDYPMLGKPYDASEGTTEAQARRGTFWCGAPCAVGMKLTGWDFPVDDLEGSERLLTSARVFVRGMTEHVVPHDRGVGNSRVVVTVQVGERACTVAGTDGDYPRWDKPVVSVELIGAGRSGPCADVLRTAADVAGAEIKVYLSLNSEDRCEWWRQDRWNCDNLSGEVDYVWLEATATSQTSSRPKPSSIFVDPDNRTYATLFGRTVLPFSSVGVQWRGHGSIATRYYPTFVGSAVVDSLVVHAGDTWVSEIGPVAARALAPLGRRVHLVASIDGTVYAATTVDIDDGAGTGALAPATRFAVVDWRYCRVPLDETAGEKCGR